MSTPKWWRMEIENTLGTETQGRTTCAITQKRGEKSSLFACPVMPCGCMGERLKMPQ